MMKRKLLGMTAILCCTVMMLGGCSKNLSQNKNEGTKIEENATSDPNGETEVEENATSDPNGETEVEENATSDTNTEAGMENQEPVMLTYSFLYDEATRDEVRTVMEEDGVAKEQIDGFMTTVKQFTDTLGEMQGAQPGFTTIDATKPFYDFEYIGNTFDKKLGFDDQNCRLTAYSLFKEFYQVDPDSGYVYDDDSVYGDLEIIKGNPNLEFSDEDIRKYTTLFGDVKVEKTTDINILAQNVKDAWAERGITFENEDKVWLASVICHDPVRNTVFAGHAGVVFQTNEGYLLIEKLSQYTPFVAGKFSSLEELNAYMLSEVAGFAQEGAADTFIMLNDQLLGD